ncbi:MAG: periplasmic heavy metal sensor [Pseudolabrys sp.]
MSATHVVPAAGARGSGRWLLLGSLALNLFFIGIAIAMAVRAPPPPTWDRNVFVRVERLAATLPPGDAELLRGAINEARPKLDAAQTQYRGAQSEIRDSLRAEPFSPDAVRAAMDKTRAARQTFDQILQGVFADATAKMTPAGRKGVADWPPRRKSASTGQ